MAPEQAVPPSRGQHPAPPEVAQVGPAADIHALGAILYDLLTGRPPYRGQTPVETVLLTLTLEPVPPRRLNPQLPRDLETICLKCLRKEPNRRYATALDLADDLQRFREGRPIQARPVRAPERAWRWCRRNRLLAGLAAAVLLLVLAGGATAWTTSRAQAERNEMADRDVNAAIDNALRLQAARDGAGALAEARRAQGLLASGAVREFTSRRVAELADQLQAEDRDRRLVARLERLHAAVLVTPIAELGAIRRGYADALTEYGLDVPALLQGELSRLPASSAVRIEVATALDWWAHALVWEKADPRPQLEAAQQLDPDSFRNQVRQAQTDLPALRQLADQAERHLAAQPGSPTLPPSSLALLGSALRGPDVTRAIALLKPATQRHPNDFLLTFLLATCCGKSKQWDEAVRYGWTAVALQPDVALARIVLGNNLRGQGALAEAEGVLREAVRLHPENARAHQALGATLNQRGAHDGEERGRESNRQVVYVRRNGTRLI